jgi:hypothetical protein
MCLPYTLAPIIEADHPTNYKPKKEFKEDR